MSFLSYQLQMSMTYMTEKIMEINIITHYCYKIYNNSWIEFLQFIFH
jgi:hypothetical protein